MMTPSRQSFIRGSLASCLVAAIGLAITPSTNAQSPSPSEARQIAEDAYIYGYSLITTEVTRVQMTNVPAVDDARLRAPMNTFSNVKRYPPGDYRGVSAPNADTLYSVAWLDLGAEPIVFSHPDMGKRYYLFPTYSLWMPVLQSLGSRTTGEKPANYLFTGPGWNGQVPAGMTQIKSPTRYTLILGRTYADGTDADYQAVNALQAQYKVVPLSAWGKPYTYKAPPVDPNPGFSMTDKPQSVILAMDTAEYFNRMAKLMGGDAPPAKEDAPMLERMAKIGIISRQALRDEQARSRGPGGAQGPAATGAEKDRSQQEHHGHGRRRLDRFDGRRIRDRLPQARHCGRLRLAGKHQGGRGLSLHGSGQHRRETHRRQQVHADVCKGPNTTGRRLLVDHHVHDR